MQHLFDELQFNSYMLYYGDLLGGEQKAEIIRRQIEIIEHLNQLQRQGIEIEGDDDSTITDDEDEEIIGPPDDDDQSSYVADSEEVYIS